ncbi:hypothetical protein BDW22DRAFT_1366689 [Trametopsis cervina]|nr:hypothetical protein BDW22DRAFT_1366689 [Trametopsis cervina]
MCGILFVCEQEQAAHDENSTGGALTNFYRKYDSLKTLNSARGPDAEGTIQEVLGGLQLIFYGSELCLRGTGDISQPHEDDEGNIMCWNGEVSLDENDGVKLLSILSEAVDVEDIRSTLGRIEGPYAIVFYHLHTQKLIFARDPLGRRSLLIHKPTIASPQLILTSVSDGADTPYQFEEVPTDGFFVLDLSRLATEKANLIPVNRNIPDSPPSSPDLDHIPEHLKSPVDEFIAHLDNSVRVRVSNILQKSKDKGKARVAVLFSGGIDSTMLAFLADRHVAPGEPIDLLNVAFENPRKILVQEEGNLYALPKGERKQKLKARLDYTSITVKYDVPDRLTGLQELEELRRLCPERTWNFVEVNVPFEEYQAARPIVEALMFPGRTVMDLSLAIALYFAARGKGQVRPHPGAEAERYISRARVLLNGLGSDELLGGYGRFRTAFKVGGWQAIIDELQLELDRIPIRNLGRDDRVISSHGKETRHPFLSLSVVSFLAQLPVHIKLDPRLEAGLGEKMLLRFAANKVGLVEAAKRKKRAMQFGSHSARMAPDSILTSLTTLLQRSIPPA